MKGLNKQVCIDLAMQYLVEASFQKADHLPD